MMSFKTTMIAGAAMGLLFAGSALAQTAPTRGNSATAPGQLGTSPGRAGTTPGQLGTTPGQTPGALPPGQNPAFKPPGQTFNTPGQPNRVPDPAKKL
jgi:hypothetical protein